MAARQMTIALALATSLTDAEFSQEFAASAKSIQLADLPDVQALTVTVVPRARRTEQTARGVFADVYTIGVAVQAHAQHDDQDTLDALDLLVEKITDHVESAGRMAAAIRMPETELSPLFDSNRLLEQHQYLSVPTFGYRLERSV